MLLAVDIGNSNVKFGVFDDERLTSKLSIPTIKNVTPQAIGDVVSTRLPNAIDAAIVCSVVPEVNAAIGEYIQVHFGVPARIVSNTDDFGLDIRHRPIEDAGTDRIVNAFAAAEKHGAPVIVCSFGTATTIDLVNKYRVMAGGLIAPGIRSLSAAMHSTASRLPEVPIEKPDELLQTSTVGCLQSGIVNGYLALVEGLLRSVKDECGDQTRVIATGGNAEMVADNSTSIDEVDPDLLLEGLNLLSQRL